MTNKGKSNWLKAGDKHYKAYVGPPKKYDLISAMQFNLLTSLGLREIHTLLDIGCGSLRGGKLFIPYLLPNRYYGIEPNQWLVNEGIEKELGNDIIKVKKPRFIYRSDFLLSTFNMKFDYILAQSIFSHASPAQINTCLLEVAKCIKENGTFIATFVKGTTDYKGEKWVYPGCVKYTLKTMEVWAEKAGLSFTVLQFPHPNGQTWALYKLRK
ncbi:class I SAM-dependent methyltransferase [Ferdinandcohnia sp. SAFN-114]|uniref:class I SAM-dependent methyltransferase n=1 Tax=Ferdinandcohnia sp. SAFN-114 TaxID=3387275 RepID=UPI003F817CC6